MLRYNLSFTRSGLFYSNSPGEHNYLINPSVLIRIKSGKAHIRSDFRYIRIVGRIIPHMRANTTTAEYIIYCNE